MSTSGSVRDGIGRLVRDVVRSTRGHDLPLYAAAVTFYATVGVVPLLLLSLSSPVRWPARMPSGSSRTA